MKRSRTKLTRYYYENETHRQRDYKNSILKFAEQLKDDPQKKERLKEGLCPICFYRSSRIGGARCTTAECAFCGGILSSGNTAIDKVCQACAVARGICRYCGGDINLVVRRKVDLEGENE